MSKKTVIVTSLIIILLAIALFLIFKGEKTDRVKNLYEKIQKSPNYTFFMEEATPEFNYKVSMSQREKDVSIDMYSEEEHTTTLILEDKSYFVMHNDKEYYDYGDEKIDTDIVLNSLKNITKKQYTNGKEKINGITYYYEEYENEDMDFIIFANINESSRVKTRFYFNGNNLCYIKNIVESDDNNQEELIKTSLKFEIDERLFIIPEDYAEVAD